MNDHTRLWHVTVTVAGGPQDLSKTDAALIRLLRERPFIHSARYDDDRAEIQYWEESGDMVDAASLALRLWTEHRSSADLPDWKVVGLEVVDQETHKRRGMSELIQVTDVVPGRF
jgi:hypothetical protein